MSLLGDGTRIRVSGNVSSASDELDEMFSRITALQAKLALYKTQVSDGADKTEIQAIIDANTAKLAV